MQSVGSSTPNPGVVSSFQAQSHTFMEIDHEIISTVSHFPHSTDSKRVVVSYKRKYVLKALV